MQQELAPIVTGLVQIGLQFGGQFLIAAGIGEQDQIGVPGLGRLRLQFVPQTGGVEGNPPLLAVEGDFGGAAGDTRVQGGLGQVPVLGRRQRELAAAGSQFGDQILKQDAPGQSRVAINRRRGCSGFGGVGAGGNDLLGRGNEGKPGQNQANKFPEKGFHEHPDTASTMP